MGNRAEQCEKIIPYLVEGDLEALPPELGEEIARHLETCAACRRDERTYRESWKLLDLHKGVAPSPDFVASIRGRIERECRVVAPAHRRSFRAAITSLAAAAAILVAILFPLTMVEREQPAPASLISPEDAELVANLDIVEHLELAQMLDVLEDDDAVRNLMLLEEISSQEEVR